MKLPLQCTAVYEAGFLSSEECTNLYNQLIHKYNIADHKLKLSFDKTKEEMQYSDFGKISFIDSDLHQYNKLPEIQHGKSAVWPPELIDIKKRVEAFAGKIYQVCVCIYYPDGRSGVDYHADYNSFGDTAVIPSLSIGEERVFLLRENATQKEFKITLQNGSILLMGEYCQERYEHCLPVNLEYKSGRINLTFRQYGFDT